MATTITQNRTANQSNEKDGDPRSVALMDAAGSHEVAELAYKMWIERGCPLGSPEEDWFAAEDELSHHQHQR